MTKNTWPKLLPLVSAFILSACVTQNYENNTPIIENSATKNEMAATRISLGLGYLNMGNMTQAKMNLEKAKNFSPDLVQVYTAFAHYYETVGENELTVQSYEKALSLAPDDADTLNNYGVFLCRQDKVNEAEVQLLKAIAVPTYLLVAQSYENLASCFLQIDNFTKAEQYLNKAIAHSPNRTDTLLQMVRLQYAMEDYEKAKIYQQKFERNTHRFSADSLALAYKVNWKLGQRKSAQNYANMLVRMYPQSWESKQYLINELEQIEADLLAKRYQLTLRIKDELPVSDTKKRVVKLSPKKPRSSSSLISNKKSSAAALTASVKSPNDKAADYIEENHIAKTDIERNHTELSDTTQKNTEQLAAEQGNVTQPVTVDEANVQAVTLPATMAISDVSDSITDTQSDSTINKLVVEKQNADEVIEEKLVPAIVESNDVLPANIDSNNTTFTKPVPAKRDAPLPSGIEYVEAEIAANETNSNVLVEEPSSVVDEQILNVEPIKHIVQKGETLYAISVKYNVKLQALIAWNNISVKQNLHVGKVLYVVNPETVNE